jgi:site-specific recombinase XerD
MKSTTTSLAPLLERFFTQRLMQQRQASPHTISSYRDTFRLLLKFAQQRLHTPPALLTFESVDAPLIVAFLDHLEKHRGLSARSRNLRLTAIHSFFRYAAFEVPDHAARIQRVLAIPSKRFTRRQVHFLNRSEVEALLASPNQRTWFGRRDHAFLRVAAQTGLRLSEMTGLTREDVTVGSGAHVRVIGKGRKERCVPLAKPTVAVLKAWLCEPPRGDGQVLFPNARGTRLTPDGVHYLLVRHVKTAAKVCPSLKGKRVTVHRLRHTMAMDLLQQGVDRSVIALWLGHESLDTTQIYLEATLAMKERALSKMKPLDGKFKRYRPGDHLLGFLNNL